MPLFAPADTNASAVGAGTINALKNVTIGQLKYLVGSVYPANWYNAGDFGGTNILNTDVSRVFDFAAYPVAAPPANSDLYDTMDSCGNFGVWDSSNNYFTNASVYPLTTNLANAVTKYIVVTDTNGVSTTTVGSITDYSTVVYITSYQAIVPYSVTNIQLATPPASPTTNISQASYAYPITPPLNALFDGNDTNINQVAFGDGILDVCDVYVTFRRSLDPTLIWYERFWTNGMRAADTNIVNNFPSSPSGHIAAKAVAANTVQPKLYSSVPPFVTFAAGNVQVSAGRTVQVPITATSQGGYPVRLLMLNLTVAPVTNAPELTSLVQFTQSQSVKALGHPNANTIDSDGNGNYAAAWLNQPTDGATGSGISGTNVLIGNLSVTIPSNAPHGGVYGLFFDHASASPNGLASFPNQTVAGRITVK